MAGLMSMLGENCHCIVVAIPDEKLPALHATGKLQHPLLDLSADARLPVRIESERCSPRRKPHVRFF